VENVREAVHLKTGDCFLLPLGRPFRLASDLALEPVDFRSMHSTPLNGRVASWNGGGDVSGVCGYFGLEGNHAGILLGMLPPSVHIRKEADKLALRWSIERMMAELREPQPGSFLELAEHVGMSRSGFAQKFKDTVGATPIDYLTRWRMLLAGDRLTDSSDPISVISQSLGYESESAFSTAFKRVMGCSPRRYSRGRNLVSASH
jgi:AraC-like DNA-binding protein